tara:strand:+ start:412176 stop:412583 length:408 start_codon:yes stop_codon:yes gene_type:complete
MFQNYSLAQLPEISKAILKEATDKVLLFNGVMGAGKTTLIKEIIKQLGVDTNVSSPTFSLVNEYLSINQETIYHFDFYRINSEEEALDIGIEDYFNTDAWCLIEWPNKVKNLLPLNAVEIYLTVNEDESRSIEIK